MTAKKTKLSLFHLTDALPTSVINKMITCSVYHFNFSDSDTVALQSLLQVNSRGEKNEAKNKYNDDIVV